MKRGLVLVANDGGVPMTRTVEIVPKPRVFLSLLRRR
jgi:hypothetical protein